MHILEVENLHKSYGKSEVLHGLNFAIEEGEILGFIGPNGAGKSTTMKCIAGLARFRTGTIRIGGYDLQKEREKALTHIGISIETPGLYPGLTGQDHLQLYGKLRRVSPERIQEMEDFTGIGRGLKKPTGTYSMGMKQRLAIAIALLHQPQLIILDEPTNGLDPSGILDLRMQIRSIRDAGTAVLLSSHQLHEVEVLADRTIFIKQGKLLAEEEMAMDTGHRYLMKVSDLAKAQAALCASLGEMGQSSHPQFVQFSTREEDQLSQVLAAMLSNQVTILNLEEIKQDSESRYEKLYR